MSNNKYAFLDSTEVSSVLEIKFSHPDWGSYYATAVLIQDIIDDETDWNEVAEDMRKQFDPRHAYHTMKITLFHTIIGLKKGDCNGLVDCDNPTFEKVVYDEN